MSMKTILIPIEQRKSMSSVLQTALLLARRANKEVQKYTWPAVRCEWADVYGAGA